MNFGGSEALLGNRYWCSRAVCKQTDGGVVKVAVCSTSQRNYSYGDGMGRGSRRSEIEWNCRKIDRTMLNWAVCMNVCSAS